MCWRIIPFTTSSRPGLTVCDSGSAWSSDNIVSIMEGVRKLVPSLFMSKTKSSRLRDNPESEWLPILRQKKKLSLEDRQTAHAYLLRNGWAWQNVTDEYQALSGRSRKLELRSALVSHLRLKRKDLTTEQKRANNSRRGTLNRKAARGKKRTHY